MLTFACVLYQGGEDVPAHSRGIFDASWVDRLYRGVDRHMPPGSPWQFVCFVDRDYWFEERVEAKPLVLPHRNMFSLMEPFREDMGRVIFMGLDTIITGDLGRLVAYDGPFAMLRDPYNPAIGCSGVMSFPYTPAVWDAFVASDRGPGTHQMFGYCSDMGFLNKQPHELLDDHGIGAHGGATGIYSYKAHVKSNPALTETASIIYFHGREKPHEIGHLDWVREHWA